MMMMMMMMSTKSVTCGESGLYDYWLESVFFWSCYYLVLVIFSFGFTTETKRADPR